MIRKSFLKSSSLPRRSAPKKKRRSKAERERIYGPKGYVEWIHEQPCIACGVVGFSEVAHIKTGGTGRKDDWTRTVPLCGTRPNRYVPEMPYMGCHKAYDLREIAVETIRVRANAETLAAETHSRWQVRKSGAAE